MAEGGLLRADTICGIPQLLEEHQGEASDAGIGYGS
jgi:hypothetical protein